MTRTLLLRADAGPEIGTGHLMRCLALAQAWMREEGCSAVLLGDVPALLAERLRGDGLVVRPATGASGSDADATATALLAQEFDAPWIVLDGYDFGGRFQRLVHSDDRRLFVIDDFASAEEYIADLLLNQNPFASESMYPRRSPLTELLLGSRFAMLRREFLAWTEHEREIPAVARRLLVSAGGSDPGGLTALAMHALRSAGLAELDVRLTSGALQSPPRDPGEIPGRLEIVSNPTDMAELMAWADMAIAPAGTTALELCFMGLPALVTVVAENQAGLARALAEAGAAVNLGWLHQLTAERLALALSDLVTSAATRRATSARGRSLVDGEGTERVVMRLRMRPIRLRPVRASDSRTLWGWANDPEVRAASFSPEAIPWTEHRDWFAARLSDPDSLLYLALDSEDQPVGYARFQCQQDRATISVALGRSARGQGWGALLIDLACRQALAELALIAIDAFIREENERSIHAFERAGFRHREHQLVNGQRAVRLGREKEG